VREAVPTLAGMDDASLITTREAAARLGVSSGRVLQLARAGRLPSNGGGQGRARLYRPTDVEALAPIPRPPGVRRSPGRWSGGAPRGNFNRLTSARRSTSLQGVRRCLPPPSRAIFVAAVVAAVRHVGGATIHRRHRARVRAVGRVVIETARAWARPATTGAELHRHLVEALRPWLELVR
jgi:excisionase family DNA binding protein